MCSPFTNIFAAKKMADSEEIYEIEQILKRRQGKNGIEYRIRWKGFDSSWDSWEPLANLGDAMDVVEDFNQKLDMKQLSSGKTGKKKSGVKRPASLSPTRTTPPAKRLAPSSPPRNTLSPPASPSRNTPPSPQSPARGSSSKSPPSGAQHSPRTVTGSKKTKAAKQKPKKKLDQVSKNKNAKSKVVSTKVSKTTKKPAKKTVKSPKSQDDKSKQKKNVSPKKKITEKTAKPSKNKTPQKGGQKLASRANKNETTKTENKKVPKKTAKQRKAEKVDSDDDDDILYSLNGELETNFDHNKEESPDPEITFNQTPSPVPSTSRTRSPIFIMDMEGSSPYRTSPPSSPSSISPLSHHQSASIPAHGREAPQGKDLLISDLPPETPVIPSLLSAVSHKKDLPADSLNRKMTEEENMEETERRMSVRQSESAFRYKEILVRKNPGYTHISLLTNTEVKNSLNPTVMREIIQALHNARYDDSKLVIIGGSSKVFCSGIDLHYLQRGDRREAARNMANALREFINVVISFPKLIVAVINGPAIGLGVAILPLFDIIYASDKASFYCPYARLAQTPEACSSYTLPLYMGNAMANEFLLGGRKLTAIEAMQNGLVSNVFWPTTMMEQVMPRIQAIARHSIKAMEQSKMLMRNHQKSKLEFTNASECQLLMEHWSSVEFQRAIREYLTDENDIL